MSSDKENAFDGLFNDREFSLFPPSSEFTPPPPEPEECPPPKPKKRKKKNQKKTPVESANTAYNTAFWWATLSNDKRQQVLLRDLGQLPAPVIRAIFQFTDFWTLLTADGIVDDPLISGLAKKELSRRMKF